MEDPACSMVLDRQIEAFIVFTSFEGITIPLLIQDLEINPKLSRLIILRKTFASKRLFIQKTRPKIQTIYHFSEYGL